MKNNGKRIAFRTGFKDSPIFADLKLFRQCLLVVGNRRKSRATIRKRRPCFRKTDLQIFVNIEEFSVSVFPLSKT